VSERSTSSGPGRVLVAVYAVFALSATARSAVQIATDFDAARLAYSLSAVSAVVYIVATIALARGIRPVAWAACAVEAVGVFVVGTISLTASEHFPDATVWSDYGQGYGFVPAVLPFLGLMWLWRTRESRE
jgi:hypothetical protein